MMVLVTREKVMGAFTSGRRMRWLGWGGTALMGLAALMMGWDLVR